ncbi:hypothetical protein [Rhizobium mesoamericanum]|uniref:Uncharacterized protein n=1 Tax=Rhizobium mesoamericanum STM3625 TaxID=1211777 RepID=K0PXS2_9HYPH|nr:hypothetical protein [Rhizobium mesoamericanum]CCM76147.1 hypothetical protein BN77_3340 [Rhizobium mesoamericanum STM3625]
MGTAKGAKTAIGLLARAEATAFSALAWIEDIMDYNSKGTTGSTWAARHL